MFMFVAGAMALMKRAVRAANVKANPPATPDGKKKGEGLEEVCAASLDALRALAGTAAKPTAVKVHVDLAPKLKVVPCVYFHFVGVCVFFIFFICRFVCCLLAHGVVSCVVPSRMES